MDAKFRSSWMLKLLLLTIGIMICMLPVAAMAGQVTSGTTNSEYSYGKITITKEAVNGESGATYKFSLMKANGNLATYYEVDGERFMTNSENPIAIKAGQTATISGLDADKYTIKELTVEGATTTVSVDGGEAITDTSASAAVENDNTSKFVFTNTYAARETEKPTAEPTIAPTEQPTSEPTTAPTEQPTTAPSAEPTAVPTTQPTTEPTDTPAEVGKLEITAGVGKPGESYALYVEDNFIYNITKNGLPISGTYAIDGASYKIYNGEIMIPVGKTAVIENLPVGTYKVAQNNDGMKLETYVKVGTGEWKKATSGTTEVTLGGTASMVFSSVYITTPDPEYFDLTIKKVIAGDGADKDDKFTFKVTFDADGSYKTSEGTKIKSGDTFKLKGGESIKIYNLPAGTTYKVRELNADEDGYEASYSKCSGTLEKDTTAKITNTKGATDSDDIPKTGDDNANQLYMMLMLVSAAAMVGIIYALRRRNEA